MNKDIILVGAFHEIIELCNECNLNIIGIIDNNIKNSYMGIPILGTDYDAEKLYNKYSDIPIVITPDSPSIRKKLYNIYKKIGYTFQSVISPLAKISVYSSLGQGIVIQHGVNVSSGTIIDDFVKLNTNANVMHDCHVGNFVSVAPNAVVLGYVQIKNSSYIGANSTILPYKVIGENSIVGAGSVVTKNVGDNLIVKGNPAK